MTWTAPGLAAAALLIGASCAAQSSAMLDAYPYLAPGETTVRALREDPRRRAAPAKHDAAEAADGAPTARIAAAADLPTLIRELLDHSPALAASRERYRAAIERVPQASTLPRPQLTYTWLPLPVETRVGPNQHRVQLVQAIPFPTKLTARSDAASAMARAAEAAHDRATRDAITRLETLYADLVYYHQALEIVHENEELAAALSQVAAERYGSQRGVLFDVARAQSQLAQLGYDRVRLTELYETTAARLNALVGRATNHPLAAPGALPAAELAVPEEELLAVALAHQQELRELDARIRAADARLSEAHSSWLPDLSVGVQLMVNGPARMPNVADSGEEALGVMVGLSLPIWFADNAARVREADATLAAALATKQAHLDDLEASLRDLVFQERDARRLRILYDEELLPQAIAAIESAEQWYRVDPARFTDFLEARGVYYSFALARERAAADHFKAIARIEQLIGATLATARTAGGPGEEETR